MVGLPPSGTEGTFAGPATVGYSLRRYGSRARGLAPLRGEKIVRRARLVALLVVVASLTLGTVAAPASARHRDPTIRQAKVVIKRVFQNEIRRSRQGLKVIVDAAAPDGRVQTAAPIVGATTDIGEPCARARFGRRSGQVLCSFQYSVSGEALTIYGTIAVRVNRRGRLYHRYTLVVRGTESFATRAKG